MDIEQLPPLPEPPLEARFRVELSERELRAVINRLVPDDTWMKAQSNRLVRENDGTLFAADRLADEITDQLIRAHDRMNDPAWRRRV